MVAGDSLPGAILGVNTEKKLQMPWASLPGCIVDDHVQKFKPIPAQYIFVLILLLLLRIFNRLTNIQHQYLFNTFIPLRVCLCLTSPLPVGDRVCVVSAWLWLHQTETCSQYSILRKDVQRYLWNSENKTQYYLFRKLSVLVLNVSFMTDTLA